MTSQRLCASFLALVALAMIAMYVGEALADPKDCDRWVSKDRKLEFVKDGQEKTWRRRQNGVQEQTWLEVDRKDGYVQLVYPNIKPEYVWTKLFATDAIEFADNNANGAEKGESTITVGSWR